ncbi:MAG: glycosyltransferase family 4 protein [Patescibacteria group bacterium]
MRIGIDCRTILNPEKGEAGGVGHYVYQLVRHLLKIDHQNEYILFFDHRIRKKKIKKFSQKNVKIIFYPFFLYSRFIPSSFSHHLFDALIKKENLNVFHFPFIPYNPKKIDVKTIATIHDLSLLRLPNYYSKKEVEIERNELSYILPFIDRIIAVSQSTKKDLIEIFNVPPEKIKVIYHGVDERFFHRCSEEEIKKVKKKYKIKSDYIFFLSPLDIRKNICRIIQAFEELKKKIKKEPQKFAPLKDIQLVLTGKKGSAFKKIANKIKKSPYKKDIILTGYVIPENLSALFDGAKVFLFPSLYEGFGLPVIEAMAKKVPVITSNLSSLPEIAGEGNAIFVNPYRTNEIIEALIKVLTDKDLREKIVKNAFQKAKEYRWEKTAQETLAVYQEFKI